MMKKYIRKTFGRTDVVLEVPNRTTADLIAWAKWFEEVENRRVSLDVVDGAEVSTVFLGLDHGWGAGPPVLYETMAFPFGYMVGRACTREDAEKMHAIGCEMMRRPRGYSSSHWRKVRRERFDT